MTLQLQIIVTAL